MQFLGSVDISDRWIVRVEVKQRCVAVRYFVVHVTAHVFQESDHLHQRRVLRGVTTADDNDNRFGLLRDNRTSLTVVVSRV